jgi:hypothetical protein
MSMRNNNNNNNNKFGKNSDYWYKNLRGYMNDFNN